MNALVPYIWVSGVLHLVVAAANVVLPKILRYRTNLAKVSPIIRQIFIVHSVYIVVNLIAFAGLCFFFAPDLAAGSRLGMVVSGYMAIFWFFRLFIQFFYYDAEMKRQHPLAHLVFTLAVAYMAATSALAAFAGLQ